MCDIMAPHMQDHVTFNYKRSDDASFWALFGSFALVAPATHLVLCLSMAPASGWCPKHVGHDASNASPHWNLLPSSIFIVLALVNSDVSHWGT